MSDNRNDFDFDDDFFQDDNNDQFDFGGDEEDIPSGLGDDLFDEDMPVLEEEPEERGGSRAFIVLAVLMILMFLGGLALVLFLILRPTGPSDIDLTVTARVAMNSTTEGLLAQTQTAAREFELLTLTASAFTDTPSATFTATEATRPPTRTPTPTLDPTDLAATQLALDFALTATALAQPTATDTPIPEELSIRDSFATEVAFATAQGVFNQQAFATQAAFATQIAGGSGQPADLSLAATQAALGAQVADLATSVAVVDAGLATVAAQNPDVGAQLQTATIVAVETQGSFATQVAAVPGLDTPANAPENAAFATQAALATQSALETRVPLVATVADQVPGVGDSFATEIAFATAEGAVGQQVFGTLEAPEVVDVPTNAPDTSFEQAIAATQAALNAQIDAVASAAAIVDAGFATLAAENLPIATQLAESTPAGASTQSALVTPQSVATQAAVETQAFFATQVADAVDVADPANLATAAAFSTPPFFSTQAALSTQVALATRAVLVEIAEGGEVVLAPTLVATSALDAVNQTATAIAGAFLTATAQAGGIPPTVPPDVNVTPAPVTPGFTPVPTALPDTGLFDTIATGGSEGIGLLALAVVGLVGVVFLSRRLRSENEKPDSSEPPSDDV